MLDWLNSTALTLFNASTTWAELLGFATGLLNVWLVVRQHIANWPVGIANVLLLMVVFLDARLYADAALQVVYVALGSYGWWSWAVGGPDHGRLSVRRTTRREWVALAVAGGLITAALWLWLDRRTNSNTALPDAATTALSLLATYGQTRKLLESWWLWIAADLIYLPLYGYKQLWLTAILYTVFLALCVLGLRAWRADLRGRELGAAAPAPAAT
jgi:nicotinamide mononucleotide transporter